MGDVFDKLFPQYNNMKTDFKKQIYDIHVIVTKQYINYMNGQPSTHDKHRKLMSLYISTQPNTRDVEVIPQLVASFLASPQITPLIYKIITK